MIINVSNLSKSFGDRLLCPGDEVEERRLAGAVGTDETDDIAFFDRKIRLLEEKPVPKGFGQIADV